MLFLGYHNMKQLGWNACPPQGYHPAVIQLWWYPFIHLGGGQHCESRAVKCLAQEHKTLILPRAWTWTALSRVHKQLGHLTSRSTMLHALCLCLWIILCDTYNVVIVLICWSLTKIHPVSPADLLHLLKWTCQTKETGMKLCNKANTVVVNYCVFI